MVFRSQEIFPRKHTVVELKLHQKLYLAAPLGLCTVGLNLNPLKKSWELGATKLTLQQLFVNPEFLSLPMYQQY